MLEGRRLLMDVPEGTAVTLDMVERPHDSALWSLREQQDVQFGTGGWPRGSQTRFER
jgi:predicted homoserine dehydrogenase-like protein